MIQRFPPVLVLLIWMAPLLSAATQGEPPGLNICRISIEDGLSQNTILSIFQDRNGFMWFGTQGGLNRYDGYEFQVYAHKPGLTNTLSNNFIYAILDDNEGMLWLGTGNGLDRFDPATGLFEERYSNQPGSPDSLSHNNVRALFRDKRGILWVGTQGGGLNRFHPDKNTFTHYKNQPGDSRSLSHDNVNCIVEDNRGNLWIGTSGGLNRFHPDTGTFTRYLNDPTNSDSLSDNQVISIAADEAGYTWIGTWEGGLNRIEPDTGNIKTYKHDPGNPGSLSHNMVSALLVSAAGELWVGTDEGINRFDPQTQRFTRFYSHPGKPGGLSENRILSLFRDRDGDTWIGTANSGINQVNCGKKEFHLYRKEEENPNGLSSNNIHAIYQDPGDDGILWIGTRGDGLNRFHRQTQTVTVYKHEPGNPYSLGNDQIKAIHRDRSGTLWVGTFGAGIFRFLEEKKRFAAHRKNTRVRGSLSDDYIGCIFEDRSGVLWVGTMNGGLNRYDKEARRFTVYRAEPGNPRALSSNFIRTIHQDPGGVFWIGTKGGGLNRFDETTGAFTHFRHQPGNPNSLSYDTILSIHRDKEGIYWIGTEGCGLNRFDPETGNFTLFTGREGLPDNTIYDIVEDNDGNLWLSTNRGLSKFNLSQKSFKNYDVNDGLQSNEFNSGAAFKSKSGEIFFGGVNGFNGFYPRRIKDNPVEPRILITDFKIFNRSVPVGKTTGGRLLLSKPIMETDTVNLSYKHTVISFDYTALNYKYAKRNRYAYILEGFETRWNYVEGRRFATYTNLGPGQYTFRVKGSNNDNVWNETGTSLKITVLPPVWSTWWFQTIIALVVFLLVLFFYRLRTRKEKALNKRLEEEVARRTYEAEKARLTAVEANTSKSQFLARMSHEIRTPLNAVIGFIDMLKDTKLDAEQKDWADSIHISGKSLLTLVNGILDFSKIESGHMTMESVDFNPRISIAEVYKIIRPRVGEKTVNVKLQVDPLVPVYVKGDPSRFSQVLINLMGNAAKFTREGEIQLALTVEEEEEGRLKLHVTVSDTGIGIPADQLDGVFNVFQQADGSTSRKFGGSGLGLSICKQVANLLGGDVWVESQIDKGSTFHFTAWVKHSSKEISEKPLLTGISVQHLPPMEDSPGDDGDTFAGRDTGASKKAKKDIRVLLVEDNLVNQKLARYMLNRAGYLVDLAVNGKEAVDTFFAEPNSYDLILMDIQMPEMDGIEATRMIRQKGFKHIPIVAMTAQTLKGDRERCLDAGMNDFLPKPIKKESVFKTVEYWTLYKKN
ncbi:MAG: response regulator [bacterium]|nr:response regulator [bacterium]